MDELSKALKEKKPKKDDSKGDPEKKARIMGMHADGDEINYIRCESCNQRFPASELQEFNGLYYCSDCIGKVKSEE